MKRASAIGVVLVLAVLLRATGAAADDPDDAYLAGYAAAVLERELGLEADTLQVEDGVLILRVPDLDDTERARLAETLATIPSLRRVRILGPDEQPPPGANLAGGPTESSWQLVPPGDLFDPLLADPRWPHFSATYQRYVRSGDELGNVAAVSFGDVIPLVRHRGPGETRWELALHAAVFSIFDIDADSFDLINSDFMVGPALNVRHGPLSGMLRLYHQSSHLGDEFLLRRDTDRINLSYEAADALLSWRPAAWLRLYGGGGMLLRREPADLERASLQAGAEIESPRAWAGGLLRPVFALDVQSRQENDWDLDLSARLGVQVESPHLAGRRLQILLDYFQGRSPNGQFFDREIEYWALGAHLHF
ncbi:MAG TPA: DUF1207 domain-containing protein [Myxococcota bacterium]|nr:DUF1207 domain-containing protein [Myxococcota bacterium]